MIRETPINEARVLSFTIGAVVLGACLFLGMFGAIAWHLAYASLVAGSLFGVVIFIWRIKQHDERGWRIVEMVNQQQQPAPVQQVIVRSPGREWVFAENDRSRHYIYQPEPGQFAAFLREAASDQNRVQFSQRQAVERGWSSDEYIVMVAQLQALHWLSKEIRNGAATINRSRIDEIQEWLETSPPAPM